MSQSVAVIHTGPATIVPIKERFQRIIPHVRMINIVDDSLLNDALIADGLTKDVTKRMCQYFIIAQEMGVDVIFNACSSVGETVDLAQALVTTPILKIDEPMAIEAVALGKKIGVIATVPTTLDPTIALIEKKAQEVGKTVQVSRTLCPNAFELLLAGKAQEHDEAVLNEIQKVAQEVDVVVLAQCSMARLVPHLPKTVTIPVLSSPDSGVAYLKDFLAKECK